MNEDNIYLRKYLQSQGNNENMYATLIIESFRKVLPQGQRIFSYW